MAEAFGVAAGAIGVVSLSIQLAESLHKVKSFYESVKNAPPQVAELIEEIEIMQDMLGDLETGSQGASLASTPTMRRCIKVAGSTTQRFTTFATELQTRIKTSRYRGGIRFALSRDDIKQMLAQLERTKSSLNLAYSLYQQATAEDRHAALIRAVSSSQGTTVETAPTVKVASPTQDITTLTHGERQISQRKLVAGKTLFKMTTPGWLSSTICQLEMKRSIAGLNIFMRTYGILPHDAPVFEACRKGDVVGMRRLFDSGLASPYDKTGFWTLLALAAYHTRIEVLRFLFQYDIASVEDNKQFVLAIFHHQSIRNSSEVAIATFGCRLREDMMWLNYLCEDVIDDAPKESKRSPVSSKAIQLLSCSQERANSTGFWQFFEDPFLAKQFGIGTLSESCLRDMLSQYTSEHHHGRTALELAAVNLAINLASVQPGLLRSLELMIALIIEGGADLHVAVYVYTPLALFLKAIPVSLRSGGVGSGIIDLRPRSLRRALKVWLNILQRAGVNLNAYGAEESRKARARYFTEDPPPAAQSRDWHRNHWLFGDEFYCFTFSYGQMPDDWTVELDMAEECAGDFWRMPGLLDGSEVQAMPGSWIDT